MRPCMGIGGCSAIPGMPTMTNLPGMPTTLPQEMNPVEHSLRTVFAHPASLAVIVGTLQESHLRANAAVVAKVLTTG